MSSPDPGAVAEGLMRAIAAEANSLRRAELVETLAQLLAGKSVVPTATRRYALPLKSESENR